MIAVATWVASLPGAVGRVTAFGIGPLLLGSAGLVMLCLVRSPLRWSGGVVAAASVLWAAMTPQPDIYVAYDGQLVAARNPKGTLSVMQSRTDDFLVKEWLAADADKRAPREASLVDGVTCDGTGCIARLGDGTLAALSKHPSSLEEDCLRAAIVVTVQHAPRQCGAIVVDRDLSRAGGALAIYRKGPEFEIVRARPEGQDRPWARAYPMPEDTARQTPRPATRDATPRAEDLEADD
jgi:competence protein ComEC